MAAIKLFLHNLTQKGQTNLPDLGKTAGETLYLFTNICVNLYNLAQNKQENLHESCKTPLQSAVNFGIISAQSQKTTASRGKLNIQTLAQNTPNACFFMRNIRTPQENADFVLFVQNLIILSMVERSGQPFAVGCFPKLAVFHPVTFYRPTVESLAVDSTNLTLESTQMYQFIFALMRTPTQCLKIRILADNEQQARARFTDGETLLFVGRINLHRKPSDVMGVRYA